MAFNKKKWIGYGKTGATPLSESAMNDLESRIEKGFSSPLEVTDANYEAVVKKRTIDDEEYTTKFGLLNRGGTGAACIQIIDSKDAIIGRIDIASDGKIYNGLTGNELIDSSEFFHRKGESIIVGGYFAGNLTGSNKTIQFTIPTPKRLDKITSATLTGSVIIRHADGGYIANNEEITSLGEVGVGYKMQNSLSFGITLKEAAAFTNNSVVAIVLQNCKITFT